MARNRDDDDDDRPRRRRREEEDDDDDDDDRPRRRRRRDEEDEEDDRPRRRRQQLSGMDGLFANTNIVLLILFACLCNPIALILGIIGLITCTDPKAKQNALITTIIGAIMAFLGGMAQLIPHTTR